MTGKELPASNIADLQSLLRRREISPREVLDVLRARIEDVDGKIDAYLSTDFEATAKQAEKADVDLLLGGVPDTDMFDPLPADQGQPDGEERSINEPTTPCYHFERSVPANVRAAALPD